MSHFGGSGDGWVAALAMRRELTRARDGKPLLGEARTIALGLRARILSVRRLTVLAGFVELNPQIAHDVWQTALTGPRTCTTGTSQGAGAALGS